MREDCQACGARLETPLGCTACGVLLRTDAEPTPFEVLGLEPAWAVDRADLRRRLLRFSRLTHPDYHGTAEPAVRALAEANSARLNDAHELLADDARRADWLVSWLGGPSEKEERAMPRAFLMEVLEWNEALEEAGASPPGSAPRAALDALHDELETRRVQTLDRVAAALTPLPASRSRSGAERLTEVRRELNALRYLDRALAQIRALRLEGASSA